MKHWIILALAASAFGGPLSPNVANYAYPPGISTSANSDSLTARLAAYLLRADFDDSVQHWVVRPTGAKQDLGSGAAPSFAGMILNGTLDFQGSTQSILMGSVPTLTRNNSTGLVSLLTNAGNIAIMPISGFTGFGTTNATYTIHAYAPSAGIMIETSNNTSDELRWKRTDAEWQAVNQTNWRLYNITNRSGAFDIDVSSATGEVTFSQLAGSGNRVACVTAAGKFYAGTNIAAVLACP